MRIALLLMTIASLSSGAQHYLVMHRYLDAACQQDVGFDQLYYWGECWMGTMSTNAGTIAQSPVFWWRDFDATGVAQCQSRSTSGTIHTCQNPWDFATEPVCQRVPLDTCVPHWMSDDTWGIAPARATHIKWRILTLDNPIVATHYAMISYDGPNGDLCDAQNTRQPLSNGYLDGQRLSSSNPKLSAPRLLFNYTGGACVDEPCHGPDGTAYPACNWRKATFGGVRVDYCSAAPYQTFEGCASAPATCSPIQRGNLMWLECQNQNLDEQAHVGGFRGFRFGGVLTQNPFDTRPIPVTVQSTPTTFQPTPAPGEPTMAPTPGPTVNGTLPSSASQQLVSWMFAAAIVLGVAVYP